jgi:hypothetical protein
MAAHVLDHFVFTARRLSERTKSIVFIIVVAAIVGNFWWFRGVTWGMDGPINGHWGLQWRKVRRRGSLVLSFSKVRRRLMIFHSFFSSRFVSRGISMICVEAWGLRSSIAALVQQHKKHLSARCGLL